MSFQGKVIRKIQRRFVKECSSFISTTGVISMVLILLGLPSCKCFPGVASVSTPGGVEPGNYCSMATYPAKLNPNMEYQIQIDYDEIEILGPVKAEADTHNVLGIASWGDSGSAELLEKARAMGADGVMNMSIDMDFKYFGIPIIPSLIELHLYSNVENIYSGIAYKYNNKK